MNASGLMANCIHCSTPSVFFCEAQDENRKMDGHFVYARCPSCGIISLQNPPDDLGRYYGEDYYDIPEVSELERRAAKEDCKISAITQFVRSGRMLEIGPAFGAFALRARKSGFEVTVIEQDRGCCESIRRLSGISVIESDDPIIALEDQAAFDVIALWHVIEHLREPINFIKAAASALKPGGILALGTPNPKSWQFHLMKSAWPHLDAPRHLHLIPAETLIACGKSNDLSPLLVDSDDHDARSWNRFGWQRLLMNRLPTRLGEAAGFAAGYLVAGIVAPFDRQSMRGSAYTLVMQKHDSTARKQQ